MNYDIEGRNYSSIKYFDKTTWVEVTCISLNLTQSSVIL